MKHYQSIPYYKGESYDSILFDKKDGSNLRFEFSQKRGFYKFGTRNEVLTNKENPFLFGIDLFLEKYGDGLEKIFRSPGYKKNESFVCFAELYGTKSEFGRHDFQNDKFDVLLFDIDIHKRGLLAPLDFIDDFGHLDIPDILYVGELSEEIHQKVKNNDYNLTEGVICKSKISEKNYGNLFYCKMKTNDWFKRLKLKDNKYYSEEIKEL